MSLELTLLGTGTPSPLLHRAGSSYLLRSEDETLLIDCGPFCMRRLLEKGVSPTEISTLLLTHLHYDHCIDYSYLVLNRWDQGIGKIPELNVYGPTYTRRMSEALLGENGAFAPDLDARANHPGSEFIYEMRGGVLPRQKPQPVIREVEHGSVVKTDTWRLRVAEVVHCQPQLTCLAYRVDIAGRGIVFGGDTAPTESLTKLSQGADVLLHMCHFVNGVVTDPRLTSCCSGHLDAARTAKAAGVGTLVLVHITEQVEQPGVRERVLSEVGREFDGQVIFGEDLLTVPLGEIATEKIR